MERIKIPHILVLNEAVQRELGDDVNMGALRGIEINVFDKCDPSPAPASYYPVYLSDG